MKRIISSVLALTCAVGLVGASTTTSFAQSTSMDELTPMYAKEFTTGNFKSHIKGGTNLRKNPANALGEFDAKQSGAEDRFYAVNYYDKTEYSFEKNTFYNVEDHADIELSEVTWGTGWHIEAVKVYLKDAYVMKDGNVVKYEGNDDGNGYFAGIAWNKVGHQKLSKEQRTAYEKKVVADRDYSGTEIEINGNVSVTKFNLPEEVVCASSVVLVDMTNQVYNITNGKTFKNNTDGYDLDAIRVYGSEKPYVYGDHATGCGPMIGGSDGKWYMYNKFDETAEVQRRKIMAGNTVLGLTHVGYYYLTRVDGKYVASYDLFDTIEIKGYTYHPTLERAHLTVSDNVITSGDFTATQNAQFGEPFDIYDTTYVFAHFEISYK